MAASTTGSRGHWVKLNRATKHIHVLENSVERWIAKKPHTTRKERQPYIRDRARVLDWERIGYVLEISRPYPGWWPAAIGDVLHNLRSALDNLAYALNAKGYADAHNGRDLPDADEQASEFPVFGNEDTKGNVVDGRTHFAARIAKRTKHVPALARQIIDQVQPYQRGQDWRTDPLWLIHDLNRIDKHRKVVVASSAWETMTPQGLNFRVLGYVDDFEFTYSGALDDGDELAHWAMRADRADAEYKLDFTFGVAFGKGTPVAGRPLVPTLHDLAEYVRRTVVEPLDRLL